MVRRFGRRVLAVSLVAVLVLTGHSLGVSSASAAGPPSTPTGVATSVSASTVVVTWNASTADGGVAGYQVHASTNSAFVPAGDATLLAVVTTTRYDDRYVPQGRWWYRIIATDHAGNASTPSPAVSANVTEPTDVQPPTPPTGLTASRSGRNVTLSWTASTDNVGGIDYEIHTANHAGFVLSSATVVDVTAGTTYVDTDVPDGYWYYRIVAHDGFGNASVPSDEIRVIVDVTPPAAPTGVVATSVPKYVNLSWTAPSDNMSGVASYDVHRFDSATFAPTFANRVATVAGITRTSMLTPGGTWYYVVVARDDAGNVGAPSAVASVTHQWAPGQPRWLRAASGDGAATLSWNMRDLGYPTDSLSYVVTLQPGGRQFTTTQTQLRVAELVHGTSYTFSVRAQNIVGSSPEATSPAFATRDLTAPRVTGLAVTHRGNEAVLSWTNPLDADFTMVVVRRHLGSEVSSEGAVEVYRGTGTTAVSSGLQTHGAYTFVVEAHDSRGNVGSTRVTLYASTVWPTTSLTPRTYGAVLTHRAVLPSIHSSISVGGRRLSLYTRAPGTTTWTLDCSGTTTATGHVSCTTTPTVNAEYQWRFAGLPNVRPASSPPYVVKVRHKVSAGVSATTITRGSSFRMAGSVAPIHAGKKVYLQRYSSGAWRTISSTQLSSTSRYTFRVTPRSTFSYRVYTTGDATHVWGASRTRRVTVH